MRRINKVWDFQNPEGIWYTFAIVGSGKNSVVVTLSGGAVIPNKERLLGTVYKWK